MGLLDKPTEKLLFRVASGIVSGAKRIAPRRTGNLIKDIQVIRVDSKSALVGNTRIAPYAKFVHDGTKKHTIKPKKKKALKTPYGLFRSVKHPGTKANPYLVNAADDFFGSTKFDNAVRAFEKETGEKIELKFKKT